MMPGAEVFDLVQRYVRRETPIRVLKEWAAAHTTWLMTAPADSGTALAGLLELNIAELAAGHATEEEIREELAAFLRSLGAVYLHAGRNGSVSTAASSTTLMLPGQIVDPGHRNPQTSLFDIRPAAVSV